MEDLQLVTEIFYGNSFGQLIMAAIVALLSAAATGGAYWGLKKWVKILTNKNPNDVKLEIITTIQKPVLALVGLLGVRITLGILTLPASADEWVANNITLLIVGAITWSTAQASDIIYEKYLVGFLEAFNTEVLPVIKGGLKGGIWLIGAIVGLGNAGYDIGALVGGLGIGGFSFALAAQDSITNILAGVTILIQRPFELNDEIVVGNIQGFVREIGLRSSLIETRSGTTMYVPNRTFVENSVEKVHTVIVNDKIEITFPIALGLPGSKMEAALDLIKKIALDNKHIPNDSVSVNFENISSKSFDIKFQCEVQAWTQADLKTFSNSNEKTSKTKTAIYLEILRQFEENGIRLAGSDPIAPIPQPQAVPIITENHTPQPQPSIINKAHQPTTPPIPIPEATNTTANNDENNEDDENEASFGIVI